MSSSVSLVSGARKLSNGGDDLRRDAQEGQLESPPRTSGGKFIRLHLSCPINLHRGWQVA